MIAINVKVATDRKRFNELYPLIFELIGLIENAPISSDGEVLVVDDHLRHLTDQIEVVLRDLRIKLPNADLPNAYGALGSPISVDALGILAVLARDGDVERARSPDVFA